MSKLLTLLLLLAASGCRAALIDLPPIERCGPESNVRAYSAKDAEKVAALMERLVPEVRAIKGVAKPAPLTILCTEELPLDLAALTTATTVFLGPLSRGDLATSLAHELSHWFSDETWRLLPYALDEGLATYVSSLVVPVQNSPELVGFQHVLAEDVGLEGFRSACSATAEAQADRTFEEEVRIRGIGLAAASAIGVETLRQLCERASREGLAKVPFEWIHEALPFPAEKQGSFKAAIVRRLIAIDRLKDEEKARAAMAESPEPNPRPN